MIVRKKHSKKQRYIVAATIAIILVVAIGCYAGFVHHNNAAKHETTSKSGSTADTVKPTNTVDYTPSSPSDSSTSNQAKNSDSGSSTGTTNTSSVSVTITRAANSGSSVVVSSLVTGATTGTCTLTATQSGQSSVSATNSITLQGNEYVCPNFTIPYSQFPSDGTWQFKLSIVSGSQTASNTWGEPLTINK